MAIELSGKKAVVTGATRGIGKSIAEALCAKGVSVIGTGTGVGKPDGCCCDHYHPVDFADPVALRSFADELSVWKPDILINNAGINKVAPFSEVEIDDFQRIMQVNLTAPFILSQAVLPGMRENNWGRIVNVSSIWGKISKEYRAPYSASKFALDGMTLALAAEVSSDGILVNCIAPGFIDTELTRSTLGEQQIAELIALVPAQRLGTVEEIGEFVAWLASPENTYITGQNIAIDGGFSRV